MWSALGQVLPQAVGIAISPIPIILVILMLVSARARVNGPAFLGGWVVGAALVTSLAYALADAADVSTDDSASDGVNIVQMVLGVLFLALAAKQWRGRPREGVEQAAPKIFGAVDGMSAGKAFGLGVLACVANPKNLPLAISGGAGIAQAGATGGSGLAAIVMFVLVASMTVAAPVTIYFVLGERSASLLAEWKTWLIANNSTVMTVLFAVLGAKMLGSGLSLTR